MERMQKLVSESFYMGVLPSDCLCLRVEKHIGQRQDFSDGLQLLNPRHGAMRRGHARQLRKRTRVSDDANSRTITGDIISLAVGFLNGPGVRSDRDGGAL